MRSIKLKEGDDLTCPARESILRARDGDNLLIQNGILLSNMEADFKLENLVFNTPHCSSSIYVSLMAK